MIVGIGHAINGELLADLLRSKHKELMREMAPEKERLDIFNIAVAAAEANPTDPHLQALPNNMYKDLLDHTAAIERRSIIRDKWLAASNVLSLLLGIVSIVLTVMLSNR